MVLLLSVHGLSLSLSRLSPICAYRSTVMMTGECWWGSGETFQTGFIQECGSAVGTFCASGQKVALSVTASVGSLLLSHAQVGDQYGVHESLGLTSQFVVKLLMYLFLFMIFTCHYHKRHLNRSALLYACIKSNLNQMNAITHL